jgi:phosphopentomutase
MFDEENQMASPQKITGEYEQKETPCGHWTIMAVELRGMLADFLPRAQ